MLRASPIMRRSSTMLRATRQQPLRQVVRCLASNASTGGALQTAQEKREEQELQHHLLLDEKTRTHMRKTYACTLSSCGVASVAAVGGLMVGIHTVPMVGIGMALGSMVPMVMFTKAERTDTTKRQMLLTAFTSMQGLSVAPLLYASTQFGASIPAALGGTVLIFGGATLGSLMLPRASLLPYGSALGGGCMLLIGGGLASIFFPEMMPVGTQALLTYGGLGLFTAFVAYDTHQVMERFRMGDDDHVQHSMSFFIDAMGIFKHLLVAQMMGDRE